LCASPTVSPRVSTAMQNASPLTSNSNLAAWFDDTVTRAYGVLHGWSNGPLCWNSVHLPAFQTRNALTPGLDIQSADNSLILSRKGEAFADDTDLWVSDNTTTCIGLTPPEGLQQLAQRWHRVRRCTGGNLGLHKCFSTFVEFEWCNGRALYVPIADSPHTVLLRTNDCANLPSTPVTRKEPHNSLRMLGAHVAPDGNQTTEIILKSQQMTSLRKNLWSSPLSWTESRLALDCIIWPKLSYTLGANTLTKLACKKIMATFSSWATAKLGFARSMASSIRHGPFALGGAQLKDLCGRNRVWHT